MHQRRRLVLDGLGEVGMTVAEKIDRDTACKIQIALAAFTDQIGAFAAYRPHRAPGVNGHQRRDRHGKHLSIEAKQKGDPAWAARLARPLYCRARRRVNTGDQSVLIASIASASECLRAS